MTGHCQGSDRDSARPSRGFPQGHCRHERAAGAAATWVLLASWVPGSSARAFYRATWTACSLLTPCIRPLEVRGQGVPGQGLPGPVSRRHVGLSSMTHASGSEAHRLHWHQSRNEELLRDHGTLGLVNSSQLEGPLTGPAAPPAPALARKRTIPHLLPLSPGQLQTCL